MNDKKLNGGNISELKLSSSDPILMDFFDGNIRFLKINRERKNPISKSGKLFQEKLKYGKTKEELVSLIDPLFYCNKRIFRRF